MENSLINLNFLGIVKISGNDKISFLHNLLSNDIKNLKINESCYATFNNNKGRIIANLLVIPKQDYVLLILSKDLIDHFIQKLKIFILRSKVEIQNVSNQYTITGKIPLSKVNNNLNQLKFNAEFQNNLIKIILPHNGTILITNELSQEDLKPNDLWKSYEIDLGISWINFSTSEKLVAQMLNQQNLGAINFKKGCYPGQEIIARTQYIGQVKRGIAILENKFKFNDGEIIFDNKKNEIGILINSCKEKNYFKYLAVVKYSIIGNKFYNKNLETITLNKFLFRSKENL